MLFRNASLSQILSDNSARVQENWFINDGKLFKDGERVLLKPQDIVNINEQVVLKRKKKKSRIPGTKTVVF